MFDHQFFLNQLFFPLSPFHRFWRNNHYFKVASLTNVGFAAGAGKTITTGAIQLFFVPDFITALTFYIIMFR